MFVNNRIRHSLKVIDKEINAEDIVALCREYKGKKILIVCNTIKSAVKLYNQLRWDKDKQLLLTKNAGTDSDANEKQNRGVYLLHSHFTKRDRAKKESHILKMGKKESTESGIWIATQIVEASLDIDFDLLFTELSDLNGLFQRLGRCYRNRDLIDLPYNCFVFTKKCSGVGVFIDKEIHRLSKEALLKLDGVITEEQKMAMIEELYTKEKLPDYYKEIKDTIQYVNTHSPWEIDKKEAGKKFRNIDSVSVIPRKVYEAHKEEINQAIEKFQNDYGEMDRIQVRELRAKARKDILELTVEVSKYLYMNMETQTLRLNDHEQILIAECDYNSQEGIIRPALKKQSEIIDFSSHSF
jgi:CRISPR-associated endonuclease/helicase Cas3